MGQIHVGGDDTQILRCHQCNFRTCFTHKCPWHEGRTCEEYDQDGDNSEEVALLQLMGSSRFQRCPRCNHGVEKVSGCDHMTCCCGHEFCWKCLATYKGLMGIHRRGNVAHKRTCEHYCA
mmetsp:Transcript_19579/g.45591  ORF Transcript_19579/g.45591 Transcript_19579/m.45591 type:complete len:120 (+) Transcript_19579:497-856(+)